MIDCRTSKDLMLQGLYGELGPAGKEALDAHLRSCPECASEYSVLGATLRIMDKRRRPDPGQEFWDGYWDRLSRRMEREAGLRPAGAGWWASLAGFFSSLPRWSYRAAGAAALVFLGIIIGKSIVSPPAPPATTASGPATAAVVPAGNDASARAENYLERSKVLLLGLVNYDPATEDPYALNLLRRKEISREMLSEAGELKASLKGRGQKRLRELVSDLEVIMLQIAHLESEQDQDAVELVKRGVEQKGIFLKIDLNRMAREAGGPAAPGASAGRPKGHKI